MSDHTAPAPVFVARALRKIYEMGEVTVEALRGVDFDLFAGEFVVLLGPSGSGKSTLLRMLAGFNQPQCGNIKVDGADITGVSMDPLTREFRLSGDVSVNYLMRLTRPA